MKTSELSRSSLWFLTIFSRVIPNHSQILIGDKWKIRRKNHVGKMGFPQPPKTPCTIPWNNTGCGYLVSCSSIKSLRGLGSNRLWNIRQKNSVNSPLARKMLDSHQSSPCTLGNEIAIPSWLLHPFSVQKILWKCRNFWSIYFKVRGCSGKCFAHLAYDFGYQDFRKVTRKVQLWREKM